MQSYLHWLILSILLYLCHAFQCNTPHSCSNMSIDFTEFASVSCRGYRSCSSSNFINSTFYCDGEQSCASSILYNFDCDGHVTCSGYRSCESSNITTIRLWCSGAKSCFNSTLTLPVSAPAHFAFGAFSLSHSIIIAAWSTFELRGFQAAFGSQILCKSSCIVRCYANACQGLYVSPSVTVVLKSDDAVPPITNLSHFNPDEFNQTIFDMLGADDESCGSDDGDLLVDSYNATHTPRNVIFSGNDTMRICVRADMKYANSIINSDTAQTVICGYRCATKIQNNQGNVTCNGEESCRALTISNVKNIMVGGYSGLVNGKIISGGDLNVYLIASWSGADATITCHEGDKCYIYCGGSNSCPASMNHPTQIDCFGECEVKCDEDSGCPIVAYLTYDPTYTTINPTYSPTKNPSHPTTNPTYNPSANPTNPTTNPTYNPTATPTYPTTNPTTHPTTNPSRNPTYNPTHSPTYNPTYPTRSPTYNPTRNPTINPTDPSRNPTYNPTRSPTTNPTYPTRNPTYNPTRNPTTNPTYPTRNPTYNPTRNPSTTPTYQTSDPTFCREIDNGMDSNDGRNETGFDMNNVNVSYYLMNDIDANNTLHFTTTVSDDFVDAYVKCDSMHCIVQCNHLASCLLTNISTTNENNETMTIFCNEAYSCLLATITSSNTNTVSIALSCIEKNSCTEMGINVGSFGSLAVYCTSTGSCNDMTINIVNDNPGGNDKNDGMIHCVAANSCNNLKVTTTSPRTRLIMYQSSVGVIFDNNIGYLSAENNIDCNTNRYIEFEGGVIETTESVSLSILNEYDDDLPCSDVHVVCGTSSCDMTYAVNPIKIEALNQEFNQNACYWLNTQIIQRVFCEGDCEESPTAPPTPSPTAVPTTPTINPSFDPTNAPSIPPTLSPSRSPTVAPSKSPTDAPSSSPTAAPSNAPSNAPTDAPSISPTDAPSYSPTDVPSYSPTAAPSDAPSKAPTDAPSISPSNVPSSSPTAAPSDAPSNAPTDAPSSSPTEAPSNAPTDDPSNAPTDTPSNAPTDAPSYSPTAAPSDAPSNAPTDAPSNAPTDAPSVSPTDAPSDSPTDFLHFHLHMLHHVHPQMLLRLRPFPLQLIHHPLLLHILQLLPLRDTLRRIGTKYISITSPYNIQCLG
eukprot:629491_1